MARRPVIESVVIPLPHPEGQPEERTPSPEAQERVEDKYPTGVPDADSLRVLLDFGASGPAKRIMMRDLAVAEFLSSRPETCER